MRRVHRQCSRCQGKGTIKREWFDWDFGMEGSEEITCRECAGQGVVTLDVADDVRCVCGARFPDMIALAAHRKEAHA